VSASILKFLATFSSHTCLQCRYSAAERSIYSEGGEDGLLQQLFNDIGSGGKLFIETGAGDGSFASTRYLKSSSDWNGMNIDAMFSRPDDGFIATAAGSFDEFGEFLKEQGTPSDLDLLVLRSSHDFALWVSISLSDIRPRVVLSTFHSGLGPEQALVASESASADTLENSGSLGPGCSLAAITWLASQLEYYCVHVERLGLFVICVEQSESSRVAGPKDHWNNPAQLWKIMEYHPDTSHLPKRQWTTPENWLSEQGLALQ
jgi:hypothetical protein